MLSITGIKGDCWISQYVGLPSGNLIDEMHGSYLGATKTKCHLWTDGSNLNYKSDWYIG